LVHPPESASATFLITYVPDGGTDPWGQKCYVVPDQAKAAFNAATNVWVNIVHSSIPITISVCWADLGSSPTLGYSGPRVVLRSLLPGAPWYWPSLANAIAGRDLLPDEYDMHLTINKAAYWYFGTDGNGPLNQFDLMTAVLQEVTHGLNFAGTMTYAAGQGQWGLNGSPSIYDLFIHDSSGNQLINRAVYGNPSPALGNALTSNDIRFQGSNRVKMYAPSTWMPGSSYSHLDYNTFNGTENGLMVYAISEGDSIHDPGPVTKGLLKDLGWSIQINTPVDIKANGSDGRLTIPLGQNLLVQIALHPGAYEGSNADWWVIAATPSGKFYYYRYPNQWVYAGSDLNNVSFAYRGPLFALNLYEVLQTRILSKGTYRIYFGVDMKMNGLLDFDQLYYDSVEVSVQ